MKSTSLLMRALGLLAVCSLALSGHGAMAQDAVAAAGEFYEVVLENSLVRVLEGRYAPGEISEMHAHPPSVVIQMTGGSLRFTSSSGQTLEQVLPEGRVAFSGGTHRVENIGDEEIVVVIVELKTGLSLLTRIFSG